MQENRQDLQETPAHEGLSLLPGGRLELVWQEEHGEAAGRMQTADVTAEASALLFTPVRLTDDLRLRDIFELLRANPDLLHIFSRDHAADLLDEVFGGEAPPYIDAYDPDGIEYLELSQGWSIETRKRTEKNITTVVRNELCGYLPRLDFNGVSFPLQENDAARYHRAPGERVLLDVEFVPPRALMNTPLRLKRSITVHAHIQHSLKRHENLTHEYDCRANYPLGQILHSILWEIGTLDKNTRAAMRQMLTGRLDELKARHQPPQETDTPKAD